MSLLLAPFATRRTMSTSRGVSDGESAGGRRAEAADEGVDALDADPVLAEHHLPDALRQHVSPAVCFNTTPHAPWSSAVLDVGLAHRRWSAMTALVGLFAVCMRRTTSRPLQSWRHVIDQQHVGRKLVATPARPRCRSASPSTENPACCMSSALTPSRKIGLIVGDEDRDRGFRAHRDQRVFRRATGCDYTKLSGVVTRKIAAAIRSIACRDWTSRVQYD